MESCLGDYHLKYCIIYLDDIIIFSKTAKEHLSRLRKVFQKLDEAGLCLKPRKCKFFRDRLEYLGHVVSSKGIETNPKKDSSHYKLAQTQECNSDSLDFVITTENSLGDMLKWLNHSTSYSLGKMPREK